MSSVPLNDSILRRSQYLFGDESRLEHVLNFLGEDTETGMITVDWNKFVEMEEDLGIENSFYMDVVNYLMTQGVLTHSQDETYAIVKMNSLRGPFDTGAFALNFGTREDALAYNVAKYNGGESSVVKLSKV